MVNILSYTSGEREVLGSVSASKGGELTYTGDIPGRLKREIKAAWKRNPSPKAFEAALLVQFSGSYIRAEKG